MLCPFFVQVAKVTLDLPVQVLKWADVLDMILSDFVFKESSLARSSTQSHIMATLKAVYEILRRQQRRDLVEQRIAGSLREVSCTVLRFHSMMLQLSHTNMERHYAGALLSLYALPADVLNECSATADRVQEGLVECILR